MTHPVYHCTILDLPDMLDIARGCYPPFDEDKAMKWAEGAMFKPEIAFFKTENVWGAATVAALMFYDAKPRGVMLFLAGRHGKAWEACAVLRAMLEWARERGAVSFTFGEDTGMRMEALARRLGAKRDRPSFKVELVSPVQSSSNLRAA